MHLKHTLKTRQVQLIHSTSKGYRLDLYEAGIQFPLSVFTFFTPPSLLSVTNLLRFRSLKHRHKSDIRLTDESLTLYTQMKV